MQTSQILFSNQQGKKWQKIGIKRRAGIVVPLFFIWSKKSCGIGEILDLKLVIDWCKEVGFSILQLLPINEVGLNISPYSLQSGFALDPIYLSLSPFIKEKELKDLRRKYSRAKRVNYSVKREKLKLLWMFFRKEFKKNEAFERFKEENSYWLEDFALYRVFKEKFQEKSWENWPQSLKEREKGAIRLAKRNFGQKIEFQKWLQWQLFLQFKEVKNYAEKKRILLKGDFPWMVSRDSADVWAKRKYFDLNFEAGAPPDEFSKKGQRWGLSPLRWEKIFEDNFSYFKERLKYLENFFDLLRVDHIIGFFRIWKIKISEPLKNKGKNGIFEPQSEISWELQGKSTLSNLINSTKILICGEDLGIIPFCLPKVLNELGIPGISVLRWTKKWDENRFLVPKEYPLLSVATLSTHDTSNFLAWFEGAKNYEKRELLRLFKIKGKLERKKIILEALRFVHSTNSIFAINLILEWLFLSDVLKKEPSFYQLNVPGKVLKRNWTLKCPLSLEELIKDDLGAKIKEILTQTGRI